MPLNVEPQDFGRKKHERREAFRSAKAISELDADVAGLVALLGYDSGSYTPTLAGMAIGTGGSALNEAHYTQVGGLLTVEGIIIFGSSGASFPVDPITVSLPTGLSLANLDPYARRPVGLVDFIGSGGFNGLCWHQTATTIRFVVEVSNVSYGSQGGLSSTVPFTWAAGNRIDYQYHVRIVPTVVIEFLLLESGDNLLLEDGSLFLLE